MVEARERIGGRAVTDSTTFGFPFDLGAQWIEAGRIKPEIYKTFPLEQAAEAHRLMESSLHIGKLVLTL